MLHNLWRRGIKRLFVLVFTHFEYVFRVAVTILPLSARDVRQLVCLGVSFWSVFSLDCCEFGCQY